MKILQALVMGFVLVMSGPVFAQSEGAGGDNDRLQALIDELKGLIEKGEKERLANPWYLRDLRETVGRYDWPWQTRLLFDEFSGKGPKPADPWTVAVGESLIDWRYGLRSVVKPEIIAQQQPKSQEPRQEKAMQRLLGGVLKEALGDKDQPKQQEPTQPPEAKMAQAIVFAPVRITNAFAIEMEVTSRSIEDDSKSRFEIGLYQGSNVGAGYRLVYIPGSKAGSSSLELVRRSSRGGSSTLELYDKPLDLQDNKAHKVAWTRDAGGVMKVIVDGVALMRVTDRSYRDSFDGITIVNNGGDFAIRRIQVDGTS